MCISWAAGTAKEHNTGLLQAPLCHARSMDTGLAGISLWPGAQAALCHLMLCPTEAGGCCLSRLYTFCWETCPAVTPALGRSTALAGAHCAHSQPRHAMGHLQPVHQDWLCVLGHHFTSSTLLPLLLPAQQHHQQPLCQHVGPALLSGARAFLFGSSPVK